jgi:hypothetical protein
VKKGLLTRLDIQYWKTDDRKTELEITDPNSRQYEFDNIYSVMKDRNVLMKSLLRDTFGYNR